MRWEDERYVRFYTRDTLDWMLLSFEAQGLFGLILRKVDRAGILVLGKHGAKGVAAAIGHGARWTAIEPALAELTADGCVKIVNGVNGLVLVVPNFIAAQEALASDTARQRKKRERDAALVEAQNLGVGLEVQDAAEPAPTPQLDLISSTPIYAGGIPSRGVTETTAQTEVPLPSVTKDPQTVTPSRTSQSVTPAKPVRAATRQTELVASPKPDDLQAIWNAYDQLPTWKAMGKKRKKAAVDALEERGLDGPAGWRAVIERVANSRFCLGGGRDGWRADPDWLLKADTADKVLEGKYDDGQPPRLRAIAPEGHVGRARAEPEGPKAPLPPCRVPGCTKTAPDHVAAEMWGLCRPDHEQAFFAWEKQNRPALFEKMRAAEERREKFSPVKAWLDLLPMA